MKRTAQKIFLVQLTLITLSSLTYAQQNLVPNPSFEEYDTCPVDINGGSIFGGNYFPVVSWTVPTAGSSDYFNICGSPDVCIPNNVMGTQTALAGNGYTGIYCYYNNAGDYREYIQVPLIQELLANQRYHISFYVSLAETLSHYAIKEIGAYLSATAINTNTNTPLLFTPQIQFRDSVITDTVGWTNIRGSFIAKGDERYLIIGNFNTDLSSTAVPINNINSPISYYYIDSVSVYTSFVMPSAFSPNDDGVNDMYLPLFSSSSISIETFRIYNRWGQLIHNNPAMGWNGMYNGEIQPLDVYAYYIEVRDTTNGETENRTGSFTLLR